jgi:hypothetical protein
MVQELREALELWTCTSWQDLVEEKALMSWEEARHNIIFLRMAKSGSLRRMRASEVLEEKRSWGSPGRSVLSVLGLREHTVTYVSTQQKKGIASAQVVVPHELYTSLKTPYTF